MAFAEGWLESGHESAASLAAAAGPARRQVRHGPRAHLVEVSLNKRDSDAASGLATFAFGSI
jgi:hypothetical protein